MNVYLAFGKFLTNFGKFLMLFAKFSLLQMAKNEQNIWPFGQTTFIARLPIQPDQKFKSCSFVISGDGLGNEESWWS